MRTTCPWLIVTLSFLTLGCNQASSTAPITATDPAIAAATPSSALGDIVARDATHESALAIYAVTLDPATLSASTRLRQVRAGQGTDDQYELDIAAYFGPGDLAITGLSATPSTLDFTWRLRHPFDAPSNLNGPASAANRADLGISGRVLYLLDAPSIIGRTYFTGSDNVVVRTDLLTNPDGYYQPNDLLATGTLLTNTFPFHAIVNEALDPRSGLSNGGGDLGNYSPSTGWQQTNIGAQRSGWTGYGMLHQGQVVTRTVSLRRSVLGTTSFSFDVAIVAKYTDPRGGATGVERRTNRLPATPADIDRFVYRAPHCALDLERVAYEGESGGFLANQISASELRFHVTDWDARATETSQSDLGADANIQTVPVGASGAPGLRVCIPGVLGDASVVASLPPSALSNDDSGFGGDVGIDSGTPRDPLFYREFVTKTAQSGQLSGTFTGLVRVEDPEAALDRSGWYFPLNGGVVPPLPLSSGAELPEPVVYQAFQVGMTGANVPPTAIINPPVAPVASGNGVLTLTVNPYFDPNGDPIQIRFDWNYDGDYGDLGESYQLLDGTPPDSFNSPIFYNNPNAVSIGLQVGYDYTDGLSIPLSGLIVCTLGPNQPPTGTVATLPAGVIPSAEMAGTVKLSVTSCTDPEGDATYMDIDWDDDLMFVGPGEIGYPVFGPFPVNHSTVLQYNNPTLATQTREINYRFVNIGATGPTLTTTFQLGPNLPPSNSQPAGLVSLQSATLTGPATFTLLDSGVYFEDPEGAAVTYTIRAVPAVGGAQIVSGLSQGSLNGYSASPVMGSWLAGSSPISFRVYANDLLHPTTAGTLVPNSPLSGTVN